MNKKLAVALVCLVLTSFVFARAQEATNTELTKTPEANLENATEMSDQVYLVLTEQLKQRISSGTAFINDYRGLGYLYYKLKKYDLALDIFKEAVAIEPNNKNLWGFLGITYKALGNSTEAREALLEFARLAQDQAKSSIEANTAWAIKEIVK